MKGIDKGKGVEYSHYTERPSDVGLGLCILGAAMGIIVYVLKLPVIILFYTCRILLLVILNPTIILLIILGLVIFLILLAVEVID